MVSITEEDYSLPHRRERYVVFCLSMHSISSPLFVIVGVMAFITPVLALFTPGAPLEAVRVGVGMINSIPSSWLSFPTLRKTNIVTDRPESCHFLSSE